VVQGAAVSAEIIDADPSLRLICCARGGPVNIDVGAASARGIPVVTTPGKNADAVAELAIAFMVMLARRLPEAIRHVESGGIFGHDNYEGSGWFGHDLAGMTLGLVGFGQIGRRVTERARAFGMGVLAFDPYVDQAAVTEGGATPMYQVCGKRSLPNVTLGMGHPSSGAHAPNEHILVDNYFKGIRATVSFFAKYATAT
jgi:D-3-phosphoglycerate dehydrogenase